jgi:hypothetical protein
MLLRGRECCREWKGIDGISKCRLNGLGQGEWCGLRETEGTRIPWQRETTGEKGVAFGSGRGEFVVWEARTGTRTTWRVARKIVLASTMRTFLIPDGRVDDLPSWL